MSGLRAVRLGLLLIATTVAVVVPAVAGGANVEPQVFNASVPPGGTVSVAKVVHTPAIPPVPDIYFLSDTTGSMGPAIANVQANASMITSTILASQPGTMFGAGNYKDFQFPQDDDYVFRNNASIGSAAGAVTAIQTKWSPSGGGDGPEGTLYALHQIAVNSSTTDPPTTIPPTTSPPVGWRANSSRILVWFGDAPAHDPVCSGFTGFPSALTTDSVAAELVAAHIRVIAISLNTGGFPTGLNADAASNESDYDFTCGFPMSRVGQAAQIATATGGLNLFSATPGGVSTAILNALTNLPVTVTPTPVCDPGLTASYVNGTLTVTSGSDAHFDETFHVDNGAPSGTTLHCVVDFLLNGLHQDGFQQTANITTPTVQGTIVVRKRTLPVGDPAQFGFTGDAAGVIGDGQTISRTLDAGTYASTESVPTGWDLSDVSCDDSDSTGSLATRTATFHLAAGETVTCTFTDTKRATLRVRKITRPSPDPATTQFTFTGQPSGVTVNGGTLSESVAPGSYASTEVVPAGWDLTALACDDSDSTVDLATKTSFFMASPGETVTCTFTDTKRGAIVVRKQTLPAGDPAVFKFTGDASGAISDGGTIKVGDLVPGKYTSTEDVPGGWDLTGLTCDDVDSSVDLPTATATFNVGPGETVTCTFTNRKRGSIVVRKRTLPAGDPTAFAFTGDAAGTIADGGTITVDNLVPGTYTSTETVPTGWDLTGLTCDDIDSSGSLATRTATFRVAAGETVTCTFTDTKRGKVILKEATVPSPDPSNTQFPFTGNPAGSTGDGGTLSESVTPGTYVSTQVVPGGWELIALACDDLDSTGSLVTKTATFKIAPGETVTCTFTDTTRGSIVVKKRTVPAGDPTDFVFTGVAAGAISDGEAITVNNLVPGTYTSTEVVPTGWDLTSLTCDDTNSSGSLVTKTATFVVGPGETVTCTFTDTKRGKVVVKEATLPSPDPSSTQFSFTGNPAGSAGDGGTVSETVVPGTYTSTQAAASGWSLTGLACDDVDSSGSPATRTATFKVAAGETVTCTFTNTRRGTIVVRKRTLPAGDSTGFAFTGDAAGTIADGGSITVPDLAPGTYTSTEAAPTGWDLTSLTCDDVDSTGSLVTKTATFTVAAGETVVCTFTDTKRGKIVVKQATVPNPDPSNTQFSFYGHPAGTTTNGGTVSETVTPGTYAAAQNVPSGWDINAIGCDDTDSTVSLPLRTATFRVAPGETVTCTFTDAKRGSLLIRQKTVPAGDPATFPYTGIATGSIGDNGSMGVTNLPPGSYISTQVVPAGWDVTAVTCDDTDSTGSATAGTATFVVAAGENVTCTFTDTKRGKVVVKQAAVPSPDPSGQQFAYTGRPTGSAPGGGTVSETLAPGTYTSTQNVPDNWDLTGLVCDDSDSTGSVTAKTATFKVAAGETVTCTFTDTSRAKLVVKSNRLPSTDTTAFGFTGTAAGTVSADGGTIAADNLPAGTYTSTQTVPAGWDLSGLSCDDGDSGGSVGTATATFKLAPGETVTCTFTTTKRGKVVVKQATNPNPDSTNQQFTYAGHPAGTLVNGGTASETLVPGAYTSTQTVPGGWGLSSVVCDDPDTIGSASGRTASFDVDPGETVTCTFTDTRIPPSCVLGYPTGAAPSLSSVVFVESDVLRAAALLPSQVAVWYNDEHALTLGIRQVAVKAKVGGVTSTTTTNYPLSVQSGSPDHETFPQVGTTQMGSGLANPNENPQAGTDWPTWSAPYGTIDKGRPMWPAIFVTDITLNPNSRSGDWQQGGLPSVPPSDVFGTWKGAVKTVDQTKSPHTMIVTPDDDPQVKNKWSLGPGSDTPPGGFAALRDEGYGAEVRWNLNAIGLQPGHAYRLQFMVHDGDQNKDGGDSGEGCFNVFVPA